MPKPLKVRRANEIVGLFVLLALAIAVAAVLLGPRTQRWFTPSQTLAIHLPPEGSLGLRKGGDVQILGSVVGSVEDIIVTDAGNDGSGGHYSRQFHPLRSQGFAGHHPQAVRHRRCFHRDHARLWRSASGPRRLSRQRGGQGTYPVDGGDARSRFATKRCRRSRNCAARSRSTAKLAADVARGARQPAASAAAPESGGSGAGKRRRPGRHVAVRSRSLPRELRAALPKINASLDELHATLAGTRKFADRLPQIGTDMQESMKNIRASSVEAQRLATALPELEKSVKDSGRLRTGACCCRRSRPCTRSNA